MDQAWPLLVYFRPFLNTMKNIVRKTKMACLGFEPKDRRIVGPDDVTELWRPQKFKLFERSKIFNIPSECLKTSIC